MMDDCVFCRKTATEILCENELAKAFYDGFPVNRGHVLVVTKKHVASYFDASSEEIQAICELIVKVKKLLDEKYQPDGYNIGVNVGKAAGQTVFHLHVHVIPRYVGDVKNPRGGVRKIKTSIEPYPAEERLGEKVYNKLVRDKIPELIREAGKERFSVLRTSTSISGCFSKRCGRKSKSLLRLVIRKSLLISWKW